MEPIIAQYFVNGEQILEDKTCYILRKCIESKYWLKNLFNLFAFMLKLQNFINIILS